jgi:hypothetical protein
MFQTLFQYPRVLARHRDGPAVCERELYLRHCSSTGSTRASLLYLARELLLVSHQVDVSGNRVIDPQEIELASEHWTRIQMDRMRIRDPKYSRKWFVETATSGLRFLGRLALNSERKAPFAELIDDFSGYMSEERGLSPRTIKSRCWHVQTFGAWLDEQGSFFAISALIKSTDFWPLKVPRDGVAYRLRPWKPHCGHSSNAWPCKGDSECSWPTQYVAHGCSHKSRYPLRTRWAPHIRQHHITHQMWSTTSDAGNLHVRFDEGDVETGMLVMGNTRHRFAATRRQTEISLIMKFTAPHLCSTQSCQ